MKTRKILGQESWPLRAKNVTAFVTRQAGHLGPVRFRLGRRWVEPLSTAPWATEKLPATLPQLLRVLRGDFFCMPFGGNETPYRGEKYPPHGETANAAWKLESSDPHRLHLSMRTSVRKGRVDKFIELEPGQAAIYSRHVISGMKGPMSFGHHAMLYTAAKARVSLSPFRFGQVFPGAFEEPAKGGYSILEPGSRFSSLQRVRRTDGQWADLSIYPARDGYEDLVLLASDTTLPFAWTAFTVPEKKYVWFALKDPRVLQSTIFWMSNGGRHYPPWNGRHRCVIGLEEVTSNFHYGLAESAVPNPLTRRGVKTSVQLVPSRPFTINYIMAVAEIPRGFDLVKSIRASARGKSVILTSASGKTVRTPLDLSFLSSELL